MIYTMHQIQGGTAEGEAYEKYGVRCGIPVYRKFGTMISQNLRKGSKGLSDLLKREAQEAFEERKNQAKKQGEEGRNETYDPDVYDAGHCICDSYSTCIFLNSDLKVRRR